MKGKLLSVYPYYDTSWEDHGVPSVKIRWLTPSGRFKHQHFYGWNPSKAEVDLWLEAKYRPRLTNLFGLIYYIW